MEAETRLFPRRHPECRNASTQVVWKTPIERNAGSERCGEPGAGGGSKAGAGEGAAAGGRSRRGERGWEAPSNPALLFPQSSSSCKAAAFTSDSWTGALSPGGFLEDSWQIPSPSIVLHPAELGCHLLPWEPPLGLCLRDGFAPQTRGMVRGS